MPLGHKYWWHPMDSQTRGIENIKHFGAELCFEALPEPKALCDGEVDVVEAGVAEDVSAHGAKGTDTAWNQDGTSVGVAAPDAEGRGIGLNGVGSVKA